MRARPIGDDGLGVEDLPHPAGRRLGLFGHGEDPPQLLDRQDEDQDVGDERDEAADGEAVRGDGQCAGEQHRRKREVRDQAEHPDELRVDPDPFELGVAELDRHWASYRSNISSLRPNALMTRMPLRRLLDHGREVAGLVLDASHDGVVVAFEPAAEHEHRDRGRDREQRERHVEEEQQREDRHDLDHDHEEEDRPERGEPPDHRDVGAGPREQLSRLPPVVEPDLEPLQVLVEVVAELRLDVGGDDREVDAPAVGERELDDRQADRECEQREEPGLVAVRDRAVDRRLHDERDRELATDRDDRGDGDERDLGAMRPQIWQNSPKRALSHGPSRRDEPERALGWEVEARSQEWVRASDFP